MYLPAGNHLHMMLDNLMMDVWVWNVGWCMLDGLWLTYIKSIHMIQMYLPTWNRLNIMLDNWMMNVGCGMLDDVCWMPWDAMTWHGMPCVSNSLYPPAPWGHQAARDGWNSHQFSVFNPQISVCQFVSCPMAVGRSANWDCYCLLDPGITR